MLKPLVNYFVIQEFAEKHKVPYNELCTMVGNSVDYAAEDAEEWKDAVLDELSNWGMDVAVGTPPKVILALLIENIQSYQDHVNQEIALLNSSS